MGHRGGKARGECPRFSDAGATPLWAWVFRTPRFPRRWSLLDLPDMRGVAACAYPHSLASPLRGRMVQTRTTALADLWKRALRRSRRCVRWRRFSTQFA